MFTGRIKPGFSPVLEHEIDALLQLMRELYQHEGISWNEDATAGAVRELVAHPDRGAAWWIRTGDEIAGYCVLTWAFSLEFGGTFGLLDELYLRQPWRGQGLGSAALAFLEQQCCSRGAGALRLEAGHGNPGALRFYERHGFRRELRHLLTKRLR